MRRRTVLIILASSILFSAPLFVNDAFIPTAIADKAPKEVAWAWRKSFKNARLGNLSAAWNGSLLVFTVTETGPKAQSTDVIVGTDFDGRPMKDWKVPGRVRKLSLDGSGQRLLVELENGDLLYYDQWMSKKPARTIAKKVKNSVLCGQSDIMLAEIAGKNGKNEVRAFSGHARPLWPLAGMEPGAWSAIFPFGKQPNQVLAVSASGNVKFFQDAKTLWEAALPGTGFSLSSSFIQGSLLAAASGGEKGEIRFFDDKGTVLWQHEFPTDTTALSCTDSGEACAVLGMKQNDRTLLFVTPQGKQLFKEKFTTAAGTIRKVITADHGKKIITAVEKDGKEYLRAWNEKGDVLWNAPVEGGILDFTSSWNGIYIAVLTRDGRVAHFNLVPPGHKVGQQLHIKTKKMEKTK